MVEYGKNTNGGNAMALMKCPECGKEISNKAQSCPNCGYLFEKTKFCKFCGEKIPMDSIICTKCGRQIENTNQTQNGGITINNSSSASSSSAATAQVVSPPPIPTRVPKEIDKNVALLLCIFLGYFGAHKFYEGKTGMGILYIFTLGLFSIGWIADIITIALKPNPYYV